MLGFQHLRARARASQNLEPFPALIPWKRGLDYIMYAVGLAAPLALLPQIIALYRAKSAVGLSFSTWALLSCVNVAWAVYAAAHKDTQLLFANVLMLCFNLTIVAGILIY